jgi:hypothetical protein
MLIREDHAGRWLVSQPAHAAVSAVLAQEWGNDWFPTPAPTTDVVLGSLLHDIGWLAWEESPSFNDATGLPHTFLQLPTMTHLDIWETASRRALTFGRYAALLVSLHGTYLYGFHNYERDTPEEAARARAFVDREQRFQKELVHVLEADDRMREFVQPVVLERNQRLIALFDGLSLAICGGPDTSRTFSRTLTVDDPIDVQLTPLPGGYTLEPWPLRSDELLIRIDARPCNRTFVDRDDLHEWLASTASTSIEIPLKRA